MNWSKKIFRISTIIFIVILSVFIQNRADATSLYNDDTPEEQCIFGIPSCTQLKTSNIEAYNDIIAVDDGYIVVGESTLYQEKNDGSDYITQMYAGQAKGNEDAIIVKYDKELNQKWFKVFGGSLNESFSEIYKTKDNGYIVLGRTCSKNGDLQGINSTANYVDMYVKYDSNFNIKAVKVGDKKELYEMYKNEIAIDTMGQISDGRIEVTGTTGGLTTNSCITKYDSQGYVEWRKTYNGNINNADDILRDKVIETDDGYIFIGFSRIGNLYDARIVKYRKPYNKIIIKRSDCF